MLAISYVATIYTETDPEKLAKQEAAEIMLSERQNQHL